MFSSALLGACSGAEADGDPEFSGIEGYGGPQNPPGNNTPGQPNAQTSAPGTGSNGSTTTNNPPSTNNNPPSTIPTNTPNSEGNPTTPPLNTGTNTGSNTGTNTGTNTGAMAPGAGGAGGSLPPDPGTGSNPTPPVVTPVPPVVTPPPPVVTPAGPDIPCPNGAIFCSGFEGTTLPAGATFEPAYLAANALGTEIVLDTAQAHSGRQSLKMPVGSNYYRMLAVATPASYWVRLYARSTLGLGAEGSTHATFFMGSIVAPGGDYNADRGVEIAEQFGQVLLNVKDSLYGTSGTNPNGQPGTRLPNNAWSCMEAQFDGASGDIHVFVEGDEIIDASGWQAPTTYRSFRFGYLRFGSPARDVWMDDVVVSASRVGCQ